MSVSDHDAAGLPLDRNGRPAVSSLTDEELSKELTVAGMTPCHDRSARCEQLLAEQRRRQPAGREDHAPPE